MPLTASHDKQHAAYEYDGRDLVSRVSVGDTPSDPTPKMTTFTFTDKAEAVGRVEFKGVDLDWMVVYNYSDRYHSVWFQVPPEDEADACGVARDLQLGGVATQGGKVSQLRTQQARRTSFP